MKNRRAINLLFSALLLPFAVCNAQQTANGFLAKKDIVIDVVLFNYSDKSIFDVYLNKKDIGVAGKFGGGRGIMTGVVIPLGPQTLTWRLGGPRGTPRNGETVTAKNALTLAAAQIPADANYLGVHVYPDETAEFSFSKYPPNPSARGEEIYKENHLYGR